MRKFLIWRAVRVGCALFLCETQTTALRCGTLMNVDAGKSMNKAVILIGAVFLRGR